MTYFICVKCGSEVDFDAWEKRWRCSNHICDNNLGEAGGKKEKPSWVQEESS